MTALFLAPRRCGSKIEVRRTKAIWRLPWSRGSLRLCWKRKAADIGRIARSSEFR